MKAQMKKLSALCMAALLLMAASCRKEKETEKYDGPMFHATAEAQTGDSKVYLVNDASLEWNEDDAILVCNSNSQNWEFQTDINNVYINEAGFKAVGHTDPEDVAEFITHYPFKAFYPYGNLWSVSGSTYKVNLPATQEYNVWYNEITFDRNKYPMAAVSGNTDLAFKNVCGLLELKLYAPADYEVRSVASITITSNTSESLYGSGTVTIGSDGVPTLGTLAGGGNSLTLDCNGVELSESADTPSKFYFILPPGTLGSGFKVKLTSTNNWTWERTASGAQNTIARSTMTWLSSPVTLKEPYTPSVSAISSGLDNISDNVTFTVTSDRSEGLEAGIVYSTSENPTLENGTKIQGDLTASTKGTWICTVDISSITGAVVNHVRQYAKVDGTAYGADKTYSAKPLPCSWEGGKSPFTFTVADPDETPNSGDEKKVYFSKGNLQYNPSTATAEDVSKDKSLGGTWKFAENQFEVIHKSNNSNVSSEYKHEYNGWIDLFGWGTSGYNTIGTNTTYTTVNGYKPWYTANTNGNYKPYNSTGSHLYSNSGKADWGYNKIYNGGNSENTWRTLEGGATSTSNNEWRYIIEKRNNNLYGYGKIVDMKGLIILPDSWTLPTGLTFTPGATETAWSNQYSYSEWAAMETAGAVFLPAAGSRDVSNVSGVNENGCYWSSSYSDTNNASPFSFSGNSYNTTGIGRHYGYSVRLVQNAN